MGRKQVKLPFRDFCSFLSTERLDTELYTRQGPYELEGPWVLETHLPTPTPLPHFYK